MESLSFKHSGPANATVLHFLAGQLEHFTIFYTRMKGTSRRYRKDGNDVVTGLDDSEPVCDARVDPPDQTTIGADAPSIARMAPET
jgi:hypothetical protein